MPTLDLPTLEEADAMMARQGSPAGGGGITPGIAALIRKRGDEARAAQAAPPPPLVEAAPRPQMDEGMKAFIADRAAQRAALAAAQGKAEEAQRWERLGAAFQRGGDLAAGRDTDEGAIQARMQEARRPVLNLQEQQAQDRTGVADAMSQATLAGQIHGEARKRAEDDPLSDLSKRAQLLAVASGMIPPGQASAFTAGMWQQMHQGATLAEAKREHDLRLAAEKSREGAAGARQDKQLSLQGKELAERERHNRAEEAAAGAKAAKELPARQAERLAETKAALDQLDEHLKTLEEGGSGMLHGVNAAVNPWAVDDKTSRASSEALIPVIARGLHGGAPSHNEIEIAKQFIPTQGDQPDVARAKYKKLRQTLLDRQQQAIQTYSETGAKMGRVTPTAETPAGGMVDVISPEGVSGQIPADKLEAALKKGFRRAGG